MDFELHSTDDTELISTPPCVAHPGSYTDHVAFIPSLVLLSRDNRARGLETNHQSLLYYHI